MSSSRVPSALSLAQLAAGPPSAATSSLPIAPLTRAMQHTKLTKVALRPPDTTHKLEAPFVSCAQLVMEVMGQLEGAYALLVKSRHFPGELVACKRGSPLILGVRTPGPTPSR